MQGFALFHLKHYTEAVRYRLAKFISALGLGFGSAEDPHPSSVVDYMLSRGYTHREAMDRNWAQ